VILLALAAALRALAAAIMMALASAILLAAISGATILLAATYGTTILLSAIGWRCSRSLLPSPYSSLVLRSS